MKSRLRRLSTLLRRRLAAIVIPRSARGDVTGRRPASIGGKTPPLPKWCLLAFAIAFAMLCAANSYAAYNVTVIATGTSSGGSWVGNTWTPSANGSTVLASEVQSHLASGATAITTSGAGSEDGNIVVSSAVSWSANTLTLIAMNDITITAALHGTGTAALVLEYGQGAVEAGNGSIYRIDTLVTLPSNPTDPRGTPNFSTKRGSDGATLGRAVPACPRLTRGGFIVPGCPFLSSDETALVAQYGTAEVDGITGTDIWIYFEANHLFGPTLFTDTYFPYAMSCSSVGTVSNGDTVRVRQTSSSSFSTTTDTALETGGAFDTFSITTVAADAVPPAFTFSDQTNVARSTVVTSNAITVSGIYTGAPISVTGGEYEINGSGTWIGSAGTVNGTLTYPNGQQQVNDFGPNGSITNLAGLETDTSLFVICKPWAFGPVLAFMDSSVFINGYYVKFRANPGETGRGYQILSVLFTAQGTANTEYVVADFIINVHPDNPSAFSFVDQTDVALSTLTVSNAITVSGLANPAAISVTGGAYEINGSGTWTSSAGTVSNGDTVKVRQTSSSSFSTTTDTALTIGGASDTFSITTVAADAVPDAFTFADQSGVPLNTLETSNSITVSGITVAVPVSIVGGQYELNSSGTWTTTASTVNNGDQVRVRHTSAATHNTATNTTLTIGGVSDTFTSTTVPNGPDLTAQSFHVTRTTKKGKDHLSFILTIQNVGNVPVTRSFRVQFFLSADQALNAGDKLLLTKTVEINHLSPGHTISIKGEATVTSPSHGQFLLGVIDATHVIAESNETNNLATVVIP